MTPLPYVRLANEVAIQFHHVPAADAEAAIAHHLQMFWDPSMRTQLLAHVAAGGADLDPLVVGAAGLMRVA